MDPELRFLPPPRPHSLLVKSLDVLASSSTMSLTLSTASTFLFLGGGKITSMDNPGLGLNLGMGGKSLFILTALKILYMFCLASGQVEPVLNTLFGLSFLFKEELQMLLGLRTTSKKSRPAKI